MIKEKMNSNKKRKKPRNIRKQKIKKKAMKEEHGLEFNAGVWEKQGKLVILSRQEQQKVLKEAHDHVLAGHPGMASTFFWYEETFGGLVYKTSSANTSRDVLPVSKIKRITKERSCHYYQ